MQPVPERVTSKTSPGPVAEIAPDDDPCEYSERRQPNQSITPTPTGSEVADHRYQSDRQREREQLEPIPQLVPLKAGPGPRDRVPGDHEHAQGGDGYAAARLVLPPYASVAA